MIRWTFAAALACTVAGCAYDSATRTVSVIARETALATIRTANAMGVDPWQASDAALTRWALACHNVAGLATVWNPAVPAADSSVTDTCNVILEAAATRPVVPAGFPGSGSDLPPPDFSPLPEPRQ